MFRCVPKTATDHSVLQNVLVNLSASGAPSSTHSSPLAPPSPNYSPPHDYSPSPQPQLSLATDQITVCSPVPNRPLVRRPTGYPSAGNRRVEKRARLEETVNEDDDTEAEVVNGAGDLTDLQVLQR